MKKRITHLIPILCLCLVLLGGSALALSVNAYFYMNETGTLISLTSENWTIITDAEVLNKASYACQSEKKFDTLQVSEEVTLFLDDNCTGLTISALTGAEGSNNSLCIYASGTSKEIQGAGKCSIGSISGVAVTLYGGTYTSLPAEGWTLGEGFCFRTGTEGNYTYSTTFTAGATVVKCTDHSFADGVCKYCNSTCKHDVTIDMDTGKCEKCGKQVYVAKAGNNNGYENLSAAFAYRSLSNLTLLTDVTEDYNGDIQSSNALTLNLNGHTIQGSIRLHRAVAGSIAVSINGEGAIKEVEVVGNNLTIQGNVEIKTLTVSDATYSGLQLKSGTFGKIVNNNTTCSFQNMLCSGYAYQSTGGGLIPLSELDGKTELENVSVVECTAHSFADSVCDYCGYTCEHDADKISSETGKCETCGKQIYEAKIGDTGYSSFEEAYDVVASSNEIILLTDITLRSDKYIYKQFTIDLNGHKFDGILKVSVDFEAGAGNLTIRDSDSEGNGSLTALSAEHEDGGQICVESGHIGTLTLRSYTNLYNNGLKGGSYDKIVSIAGSLSDMRSKLLPNGYAFRSTEDNSYVALSDDQKELTKVTVVKCEQHVYTNGDGKCDYCHHVCEHGTNNSEVSLTDGKCTTCGKQIYVAKVGETLYDTLQSALDVSKGENVDNITVTLLSDVELKQDYSLAVDKYQTIDLNGHSITGDGSLKIGDTYQGEYLAYLTVKDSTGKGKIKFLNPTLGALTVEGGTVETLLAVTDRESLTITLSGGTYGKIGKSGYTLDFSALLDSGCAYQDAEGNRIALSGLDDKDELSNVTVVKCPHTGVTGGTTCDFCGTALAAKIGDTGYLSCDAALAAAKAGETLTLLTNVTENLTITDAPKFTLDLNGKNVTGTLKVENQPILLMDNQQSGQITKLSLSGSELTLGDLLPEGWGLYNGSWRVDSNPDAQMSDVYVKQLPIQSLSISASPEKTTYTYGETITFTATVDLLDASQSGNVTYSWNNAQNTSFPGGRTATCTVDNLTVGEYSVYYLAVLGSYGTTSEHYTFTVTQATPNIVGATASMTYGAEVKDSDIQAPQGALAGTYQWSGVTSYGDAGTKTLKAIFTPTDTTNYTTAEVDVEVTVTKANYSGTTDVNGAAKYGNAGTVDLKNFIQTDGTASIVDITDSSNALSTYSIKNDTLCFSFRDDAELVNQTAEVTISVENCKNYEDYQINVTLTVTEKSAPTVTAPTAIVNLIYNGEAQTLISAGSTNGGTMQYRLDGEEWSDDLPTAKNAGKYTLYYKVVGDNNYADVAENHFEVSIAKAELSITADSKHAQVGEAKPELTYTVSGLCGADQLSTEPTLTCEADLSTAGTYAITASDADAGENYVIQYVSGELTVSEKPVIDDDKNEDNQPSDPGTDDDKNDGNQPSNPGTDKDDKDNGSSDGSGNGSGGSSGNNSGSSSGSSGSSGGGSSSSDKTNSSTTVKNDDGSTTTTKTDKKTGTVTETTKKTDGSTTVVETKKDGTVTETNTNVDGSTSVVETKKDGTVTETNTNTDGSTSVVETKTDGTVTATNTTATGTTATTVTDESGNRSTSVTVSTEDAQSNATVTLPVEDVKASRGENATKISVEVPEDTAVTVEVPVENVTPGTVIVVVAEDGTETVIPTTKMTENGVSVTLSENSTIKIVENSKTFSDVKEDDYYNDAVDFASSRGITGGTSEETFSPDASCTRGQLVTFLWRAAGQPESGSDSGMSDVAQDSYYTDAVQWAASEGIVSGYDNGQFGSDDTVTREQMAVILYRFAQNAGMDTTQNDVEVQNFNDYDNISDYAVTAMQWAVNAGIMQGYENNLMPTTECTRAQIVTMLYRLLGE